MQKRDKYDLIRDRWHMFAFGVLVTRSLSAEAPSWYLVISGAAWAALFALVTSEEKVS